MRRPATSYVVVIGPPASGRELRGPFPTRMDAWEWVVRNRPSTLSGDLAVVVSPVAAP